MYISKCLYILSKSLKTPQTQKRSFGRCGVERICWEKQAEMTCAVKTYSACRCTSIAEDGCAKTQREALIYMCIYICANMLQQIKVCLAFLTRTPEHWGNGVNGNDLYAYGETGTPQRRRWAQRRGMWRLFLSTSALPHAALCRHSRHTRGRFSVLALVFIPATSLAHLILL